LYVAASALLLFSSQKESLIHSKQLVLRLLQKIQLLFLGAKRKPTYKKESLKEYKGMLCELFRYSMKLEECFFIPSFTPLLKNDTLPLQNESILSNNTAKAAQQNHQSSESKQFSFSYPISPSNTTTTGVFSFLFHDEQEDEFYLQEKAIHEAASLFIQGITKVPTPQNPNIRSPSLLRPTNKDEDLVVESPSQQSSPDHKMNLKEKFPTIHISEQEEQEDFPIQHSVFVTLCKFILSNTIYTKDNVKHSTSMHDNTQNHLMRWEHVAFIARALLPEVQSLRSSIISKNNQHVTINDTNISSKVFEQFIKSHLSKSTATSISSSKEETNCAFKNTTQEGTILSIILLHLVKECKEETKIGYFHSIHIFFDFTLQIVLLLSSMKFNDCELLQGFIGLTIILRLRLLLHSDSAHMDSTDDTKNHFIHKLDSLLKQYVL